MADRNQGEHLPVLPLSQILERLTRPGVTPQELRESLTGLTVHVVNLNNKIRGLEARLDRTPSFQPGDQVTGG